jgi:hypothetical protein
VSIIARMTTVPLFNIHFDGILISTTAINFEKKKKKKKTPPYLEMATVFVDN